MHLSSLILMNKFFVEYVKDGDHILDVGSKISRPGDVGFNSLLGPLMKRVNYTGLDIEEGENVDIVVEPYNWWQIEDGSFNIVISGQTLEHDKFFWKTFIDMVRVLKPGGYMCVIVPKIQKQHRFPVDCWRFYPDAMYALAEWAGITCISADTEHVHYDKLPLRPIDCVGVFQK